jgi:hypothetical protein
MCVLGGGGGGNAGWPHAHAESDSMRQAFLRYRPDIGLTHHLSRPARRASWPSLALCCMTGTVCSLLHLAIA